MNPLLLEFVRQSLRWISLSMTQVPWFTELTENEDFVIWVAGLITYAATDLWWLRLFVAKYKQWWGRK